MKQAQNRIKSFLDRGFWFWVALAIGALNRLSLFLVSRRTTDDYIEPIQRWIETGNFPNALDCMECFQPPLFFSIVKGIAAIFNLSSRVDLLITIQVVNLVFGLAILYFILLIVQRLNFKPFLGFCLMLFAALNPELISVNVLGTNDNLSILLGLGITHYILKSLKQPSNIYILCFLILLGVATKGNQLVYLGLGSIFIIASLIKHRIYWSLKYTSPLILLWIASLFVGGFVKKYNQYDDPFAIPREKQPLPSFFEKTNFDGRPGVESIASAFGTFQFKSLIEEPFNHYEAENYPTHRTSMFTQFYGQFSNYFFERHPNSWTPKDELPDNLARVNYSLHLPILLIFLFGMFMMFNDAIRNFSSESFIHLVIISSFVLFVMVFSSLYRDFTYMKLHYTFPALYSLIFAFSKGLRKVPLQNFIAVILLAASLLYVMDAFLLVEVLYSINI